MEENPVVSTEDPLEINKNPKVIKEAQKSVGKVDVLVCGSCHDVFHFIEEFMVHKSVEGACPGNSTIRENYQHEPKPQVWAFMLWKSSQYKNIQEGEQSPTSWIIYQRWCKLSNEDKEAWLVAAKNVQYFTKLSTAKMQEVRVKSQAQLIEKKSNQNMVTVDSLSPGKKTSEQDPLDEGEIRISQLPEAQRIANRMSDDADPLGDIQNIMEEAEIEESGVKKVSKPIVLNSDVTILPSNKKTKVGNKRALRTDLQDRKEEYAVEKIVSKRFNPRKKTHEYLIKWEHFDKSENTWEPIANLQSCKEMLEEFEKNLEKQKLQRAVKAAIMQKEKDDKPVPPLVYTTRGRPQRTSKQKALNQVKVWCGDISDADDESSGKRKRADDSDSDSVEKRIKREAEEDSDSSGADSVRPVVKKVIKTTPLKSYNGVDKPPLPHNILIPDAQGIIRINQKQASELSSGVYIMSKTAGIIKLDSNTSRMATSGGQTIVKVAPKIGQTHIKVVRKDVTSNVIKLTPKETKLSPNMPKVTINRYPGKVAPQKPPSKPIVKKKADPPKPVQLIKPEPPPPEDDSSDGVSELEFPTDIILPLPESPPREFTLDPDSGKLVGVDYPEDREVVIYEEQPRVTPKQEAFDNSLLFNTSDSTDDSQTNNSEESPTKEVEVKPEPIVEPKANSRVIPMKPIKKPSSNGTSNNSSILQRKLLSTPTRQPIVSRVKSISKPHVLNSSLNRSYSGNTMPKPIMRTRIVSPRQYRSPATSGTPTITRIRHPFSSVGKGNSPKKIGQTTIYRTSVQKSPGSIIRVQEAAKVEKPIRTIDEPLILPKAQALTKTATTSQLKPEAVISMPSLTADTEEASQPEPESAEQLSGLSVTDSLTDLSSLVELQESTETPLMLTGEDGTVYQVAGQNEQGQTILISQGADGEQQCLVVATESLQVDESSSQPAPVVQMSESDAELQETLEGEPESDSSAEEQQVVAQLISADPPSPGGKRNVTVMLPDGSCVTMSVTQEQYESLELDK